MRKKLYMGRKWIFTIGFSVFVINSLFSQVGVNTETPKVTLDVNKKNILAPEGILAPRLTVAELTERHNNSLYGTEQNAAIVYVSTDKGIGSTGTPTEYIKESGYYYYDASPDRWRPLGGGGGTIWYKTNTTVPSEKNVDDSFLIGRVMTGTNLPANVNSDKKAQLTVEGEDAVINGITVGTGNTSIKEEGGLNYPSNAALGFKALSKNKEEENTAIGMWALANNTTGKYNTAIGSRTLIANTIGQKNLGLGAYTLVALVSGDENTAVGYNVMPSLITGINNVGVGSGSLGLLKEGSNNVAVGKGALYNSTGNSNIALGYNANTGLSSGNYTIAIGEKAMATGDSSITIGHKAENPKKNTTFLKNYSTIIGPGMGNVGNVSLQINGEPDNAGKADGILIPKLTRPQLIAKGAKYISDMNDQHGTLVFIPAYRLTEGTPGPKEEDVNSTGFYYFNAFRTTTQGSTGKWVRLLEITDTPDGIQYRKTSVTVGEGKDYPNLQAAYIGESKKMYNQYGSAALEFHCFGDVGGLVADGTIPFIKLIAEDAVTLARLNLSRTKISIGGTFTINSGGIELYDSDLTAYNNTFILKLEGEGITVDRSTFKVIDPKSCTIEAPIITSSNGEIWIANSTLTMTGKVGGLYMLGSKSGGIFELTGSSVNFNNSASVNYAIYAYDNGTFTSSGVLKIGGATEACFYSTTNSHIQLKGGTVNFSGKYPTHYVLVDNHSKFTISGGNTMFTPVCAKVSAFRSVQGSSIVISATLGCWINVTECTNGLDADGGIIRIVNFRPSPNESEPIISLSTIYGNPLKASNGGQIYTLNRVKYTGAKPNQPNVAGEISSRGSVIYDSDEAE